MDELYSNRALAIKIAFCISLPFVHIVVSSGFPADSFLALLCSNMLIGCLFTIPLWMSLVRINRYGTDQVLRYVLLDFLCCYVPTIGSSLVYETVAELLRPSALTGVLTLLLIIILLLISGVFWLLYGYIGKHNRP